MDARTKRIQERILHDDTFVCNPGRNALKQGKLLIPDSFDPQSRTLKSDVLAVMQVLFERDEMQGAVLVSKENPPRKVGEERLLIPLIHIADAVRESVKEIAAPSPLWDDEWASDDVKWKEILAGEFFASVKLGFEKKGTFKEVIVTTHGPVYPKEHPRYQPYPMLSLIRNSAFNGIKTVVMNKILRTAYAAAGRSYNSGVFLMKHNDPQTGHLFAED